MQIRKFLCRIFIISLSLIYPPFMAAQQPAAKQREADVVKTASGDLKITPITHGSVMLEWSGKVIHVDPWSQGDYTGLPKADLILVTDIHGDHMDPKAIAALKKEGTIIVAPEAVAKTVTEAKVLRNGEKTTLSLGGSATIEAVPMYNLNRGPAPGQLYHTKGRGNGYVIELGGKRVYFSGDTECVPEIKALRGIDIAFLCMNLPYTQTSQEAAECVKAFRPKLVYPYHYRGQDTQAFAEALKGEKRIEVRLRNWY